MRYRRLSIISECETLWAKIVKVRDFGRCQVCGRAGSDSMHLFGRENWKVKFDPDLGACGCREHHTKLDKGSPEEKEEMFEKIISHIRNGRLETILTLRAAGKQPPLQEKPKFQEIRARLRIQLKEAEDLAAMNFDIER